MYDIRVLSSGDMTLCVTLSGHTSTRSRLVVQGPGFEASFLSWALVKEYYVPQDGCFFIRGHDNIIVATHRVDNGGHKLAHNAIVRRSIEKEGVVGGRRSLLCPILIKISRGAKI